MKVLFLAACLIFAHAKEFTAQKISKPHHSTIDVEAGKKLYYPELLGDLFRAVQLNRIFPDSKTFPDCILKSSVEKILKAFEENGKIATRSFVEKHFDLPEVPVYLNPQFKTMKEYISNWDIFIRSSKGADDQITSLIPLPHPYLVAGGRFREMYYWDGYFIMLGLSLSDRWDLVTDMLENYADLIKRFGFIPNGNRTYYLTRSQPPFFSLMVSLYASKYGKEKAMRFLPQLEQEYRFWMSPERVVYLSDCKVLNHYWDEASQPRPESYYEDFTEAQKKENKEKFYRNIRATAESGWDFSSRWVRDTTEILPVDLNVLLCNLETMIAEFNECQGCKEKASLFFQRAENRRCAIQEFFWDPGTGFYQDYDYVAKQRTGQLTLAGVFPLLFKIANSEQARQVADRLENRFLYPGGLVTTLQETGEQWDYPNGWAPLQNVAVSALIQYGHDDLAERIARRWLATNQYQFERTGYMYEKYDVVNTMKIGRGGEYEPQIGFGWTNGVALSFLKFLETRQKLVGQILEN